jgi:hypothetical protein
MEIKKYNKYAQHNIINPPTFGINTFLQFPKNRLQPNKCYISGRINYDD